MAFFSRSLVNLNSLSLLNHCYCKFSTSIVKSLHVSPNFTVQNKLNRLDEKIIDLNKISPFDKEFIKRRDQACRSILVQVESANSYEDLYNYCNQFGQILNVYHYHVQKQNYILVEFQNATMTNEIMRHATFTNEIKFIPTKLPIFWFRKEYISTFHHRKNNKKNMPPFIENSWTLPNDKDIMKLLYNAKSISGQIISLYEALKLNDLEMRLRFHTAHIIEKYFSLLFENVKVLPFGSSVNGFGRKRCDVDLVMIRDTNKKFNVLNRLVYHVKNVKREEKSEIKEFLSVIASIMHTCIPGIRNIRKILEARVPIIKFNYEYTRLECDLSTTNMTAVYMSELLFLYGEIDWRVRPLVTTVRQWAKFQDITSDVPGTWITNFSLTLLVLFYLQEKKILPSLNILKTYATNNDIRFTETGIDCTFLRDIKKLPLEYIYKNNQNNLEELLHGFFEYYSKFDFDTKGICIREGKPVKKLTHTALHITNPLETTLNVSRNVNIFELNRIIQKAHDALYLLETADNSDNSWGLMTLLNQSNINTTNFNIELKKDSQDFSENHSHEAVDKYEVNDDEIDIPQSESQKKETEVR